MQHQQVAADYVASGDPLLYAIANDQRTWRRQITQRLQRTLRLALLRQCSTDDREYEGQQKQRLGTIAQSKIDTTGGQQHQEHWLGQHLDHDPGDRFGLTAR